MNEISTSLQEIGLLNTNPQTPEQPPATGKIEKPGESRISRLVKKLSGRRFHKPEKGSPPTVPEVGQFFEKTAQDQAVSEKIEEQLAIDHTAAEINDEIDNGGLKLPHAANRHLFARALAVGIVLAGITPTEALGRARQPEASLTSEQSRVIADVTGMSVAELRERGFSIKMPVNCDGHATPCIVFIGQEHEYSTSTSHTGQEGQQKVVQSQEAIKPVLESFISGATLVADKSRDCG